MTRERHEHDEYDEHDERDLRAWALQVLEEAWQNDAEVPGEGYTAPNLERYPYQWLWDSCFHALVWAHLDRPDRALAEMRAVFRWQSPSGFVPHMGYQRDPTVPEQFWRRHGCSAITQPPMYGHALVELRHRGLDVPEELFDRARLGISWMLRHRRRHGGLIVVVHPWESGCDDSPNWDAALALAPSLLGAESSEDVKGRLVGSLVLDDEGASIANPAFEVASRGFSALVAFNALELELFGEAQSVIDTFDDPGYGEVRSLDDLLPVLCRPDRALLELALDERVFGGRYGPAGVRRDDPTYDPLTYWRGPAWPQLTYLLWCAAKRAGADDLAARFATSLRDGARRSDMSEYWHPDTGQGLGARPQSWTTLAALFVA